MDRREPRALRGVCAGVRWAIACAVALALGGCGERRADGAAILDDACAFGDEVRLTSIDGPMLDGLALVARGDDALDAVWSDRSGLYVQPIDGNGVMRGAVRRIGARCDAGVDAIASDRALLVACGERADDARARAGRVVVWRVEGESAEAIGASGPVGPDSEGVAIAQLGEAIWVGWQDARASSSSAQIARLGSDVTERLSRRGLRASRPALGVQGDALVATWAETGLDARGDAVGVIMLRVGARAARELTAVAHEQPLPTLAIDERGIVVTLRDRRPARTRPRVVLVSAGDETREELGVHANAQGAAVATPCAGDLVVVAPRSHSRTDSLVSVRRHARTLEGLGAETQIYENGAEYEWADAACAGDRVVVLVGERAGLRGRPGSVRVTPLRCVDGAAP